MNELIFIQVLNRWGYKILCIISPLDGSKIYFCYDKFTPADNGNPHQIKGRDITALVETEKSLYQNVMLSDEKSRESSFLQKLEAKETQEISFSSHFLFVNYLPKGYRAN